MIPNDKPRIDLLRGGPMAGQWRCMAINGVLVHRGACFGKTPAAAYAAWKAWQEHVKTQPFAFLGVAA